MTGLGNFNLLLAQDSQAPLLPPVPGEGPAHPGTVAPSGPAGNGGAPAGSAQPPMGPNFLLMVGLLVTVMIVFTMMSQRRERKRREATINAIKKHDRVQTIGGVIGSVVEIKPDFVVLKVDESSNTRITFTRAAIQQVLSSSADTGNAKGD